MCLKRVEKKKLLAIVLEPSRNFPIFTGRTGKHLCWSLFLIQNIAKFLREPILKNICFSKDVKAKIHCMINHI